MVDVQENGIELFAGALRIETTNLRIRNRKVEEAAMHVSVSRIAVQVFTQRHQLLLMPADDRFQVFNHQQLGNPLMPERRHRGVTQAQTTDNHTEVITFGFPQPDV